MDRKTLPMPTEVAALTNSPVRILLVDDHEMVRLGMARLLANEPRFVLCGEAADGPTALRLLRAENPDVAIIDISLQEGSGLELIKQIKATHPQVRIIVLSMHDEELFASRVFRAGAEGYVSKLQPAGTILTAIKQVLAGEVYLNDRSKSRLVAQATRAGKEMRTPVDMLSDRELDIFQRIGLGQTAEEIAQQLHLSPKTVSTYRDRIRAKMNLDSAATLVRHASLWMHEQNQGK